ncbi:13788_t:CDS:1, partial [Gigaspora margarita]
VINNNSVQALSFTNSIEFSFFTNPSLVKHARYNSLNKEDELLKQLKEFEDSDELPTEVVNELVEALSQYTDHWTPKKIKKR